MFGNCTFVTNLGHGNHAEKWQVGSRRACESRCEEIFTTEHTERTELLFLRNVLRDLRGEIPDRCGRRAELSVANRS